MFRYDISTVHALKGKVFNSTLTAFSVATEPAGTLESTKELNFGWAFVMSLTKPKLYEWIKFQRERERGMDCIVLYCIVLYCIVMMIKKCSLCLATFAHSNMKIKKTKVLVPSLKKYWPKKARRLTA